MAPAEAVAVAVDSSLDVTAYCCRNDPLDILVIDVCKAERSELSKPIELCCELYVLTRLWLAVKGREATDIKVSSSPLKLAQVLLT